MISQSTLRHDYLQRVDGLFEKVVHIDAGGRHLRIETIIRDQHGQLIRVDRKRPHKPRS